MSRVALIQGEDRYANIKGVLEQAASDVDLSSRERVLIKPNFVVSGKPLAATHNDAMRAVLDSVRARYDGPLTIAEGPSTEPAAVAFQRYGYHDLAQSYDADLLDLNHDEPVPVTVYNSRLRPLHLDLARSVIESDFRISVGPPKTHDYVIATLSLKNMIMGSLISRHSHSQHAQNGNGSALGAIKKAIWTLTPMWVRTLAPVEWLTFRAMSLLEPSSKMKMHQSYPVINLNLALLAPVVAPHLSVLDAYDAMEGNGPTDGDPVALRLAVASSDPLAADTVGAALMGFEIDEIGYLSYCKRMGIGSGDLSQIDIVGNVALSECARKFRRHPSHHRQRRWHLPDADRYLSSHPLGGTP